MTFAISHDHFTEEDEALAEIESRGWFGLAMDVPAEDSGFHWHEFNTVIYLVDGSIEVQYPDGRKDRCGPGTRVEASARLVHREVTTDYRAVYGWDVDPATMTQPVNKPPELLDS